VDKTEKML